MLLHSRVSFSFTAQHHLYMSPAWIARVKIIYFEVKEIPQNVFIGLYKWRAIATDFRSPRSHSLLLSC